ncbi:MAG: hypothetical protein WEA75_05220 [Acidimicrobiia bacterium]
MRRLLALLGALAMVGFALGARSWWIDDDSGGSNGSGTPVVLCATELAAACDELARNADVEIVLEPAGVSTGTLSTSADTTSSLPYDGWLTFEPNAEIVREARVRSSLAPLLEDSSPAIARSPLLLAIWDDRAEVLESHCGEITWRCLGDVAGTRWQSIGGEAAWGDVKPGHADPEATGEGLAIIGQAAAQFFDRSDLSRDDFEEDAFLDWFARVERAAELDADAYEHMLSFGPARYDVVATTEAVVERTPASRDRQESLRLLYPAPVATVDVVFAPFVGGSSDLADIVTGDDGHDALTNVGFRSDSEGDKPTLQGRSNLPDSGALVALLQTWREVTG